MDFQSQNFGWTQSCKKTIRQFSNSLRPPSAYLKAMQEQSHSFPVHHFYIIAAPSRHQGQQVQYFFLNMSLFSHSLLSLKKCVRLCACVCACMGTHAFLYVYLCAYAFRSQVRGHLGELVLSLHHVGFRDST